MYNSLVNTFRKNYRPKLHDTNLRKVGIELEFPIVKDNGEAVDYDIIRKMFSWLEKKDWKIAKDGGTGEIVAAEKSISKGEGRFGYDKDVIGTDVGYCTVEASLSPEDNLFALVEHWKRMKAVLLEFFTKEHCHILGYGVQPLSPPNRHLLANKGRYKFFEQDSLNRFIDQKYGLDLHVFATSAANQCHIDVYDEEAIRVLNMLSCLAPLLSAVTANASVWKGFVDPEWTDIREIFWDKSWSNRIEQTGIPDTLESFEDYVERLCRFRPLMVKRNNEYIKILNCKTFGEYFEKGKNNIGETVAGEQISLESIPEDIIFHNGFAWWDARLAPLYGTVEVRPCSQQPDNAILAPAAFSLGLIENLSEAEKLYKQYMVKDWRKLRFDVLRHGFQATIQSESILPIVTQALTIAKEGLKSRNLGEEKFLEVLEKRVANKKTQAEEVKDVFDKKDLKKFFELVEIA